MAGVQKERSLPAINFQVRFDSFRESSSIYMGQQLRGQRLHYDATHPGSPLARQSQRCALGPMASKSPAAAALRVEFIYHEI